jgi:hypothetical protein
MIDLHNSLISGSAIGAFSHIRIARVVRGGMGWGMGLIGLLVALVLILVVAALIKYLFFR